MNLQELEKAIATANQKIEELKAELLAAKEAKKQLEKQQKTIKKNIDKVVKVVSATVDQTGVSQGELLEAINTKLNTPETTVADTCASDATKPTASDATLPNITASLNHLQSTVVANLAQDDETEELRYELETNLTMNTTLEEKLLIAKNLGLSSIDDLYSYVVAAGKQEMDTLEKEIAAFNGTSCIDATEPAARVRVARNIFKDVPLQHLNLPTHIEKNLARHNTKITNVLKLIDCVLIPLMTSDNRNYYHTYVRQLISKDEQQTILNKLQETLNLVVERDGYSVKCYVLKTGSPYQQLAA